MGDIRTFFRFCPTCGRRFHIKLVGEQLVGERKEVTEIKQASLLPAGSYRAGGYLGTNYVVVEENVPLTIDVREFQYTYKCKHCGHVWSEIQTKESNG